MLRFAPALICLTSLLFAVATPIHAALTIQVVDIYDENTTRTNAVDHSATSDGVRTLSLASFSSLVNEAYAAGFGGVINFDTGGAFSVKPQASTPDQILAQFGPGFSKTLTITNGSVTEFLPSTDTANRTPISGNRYLGKSGTAAPGLSLGNAGGDFIFDFTQQQRVVAVGGTLLSRASFSGNATGRVTFSDGTMESVIFNQAASNGLDDVFYGFQASDAQATQGIYITQFAVLLSSGQFRGFDDLAFVVAPEPTKALLLLAGLGCFALVRRRR